MEAKIVLFLLLSSITYIKAANETDSSSPVVTESTASTDSSTLKPTSEVVPVTTVAPGNFSCAVCNSARVAQRDCANDVVLNYNSTCELTPKNETDQGCYILRTSKFFLDL